jgi:flagellar biosynthetic protein FliQ
MTSEDILRVAAQAFSLALRLSAPVLVATLIAGLVLAIVQAFTQVHDGALSFVPKLVVGALVLLASGSWMGRELVRFTAETWSSIEVLSR